MDGCWKREKVYGGVKLCVEDYFQLSTRSESSFICESLVLGLI